MRLTIKFHWKGEHIQKLTFVMIRKDITTLQSVGIKLDEYETKGSKNHTRTEENVCLIKRKLDWNFKVKRNIWKLKDNFSYSTFSPVYVLCYVWNIVTHSHLDIECKGLWNVSVYSTIVCLANSCPKSSSFHPLIFLHFLC